MLHKFLSYLLFSIAFLISISTINAQVTIFDANFSGNGSRSGGASGEVGGSWSSTPRSGDCLNDASEFFGTQNGSFEITNFEGSGCTNGQGGNNDSEWRTNPINTRNYSNISVVVELSGIAGGSGFDGSPSKCVPTGSSDCVDQIRVLVSLDGESFSSPTYRPNSNSFSATYNEVQGFCGDRLIIRIIGGTQAANESFFIDRVLVTGQRGGKPSAQNASAEACEGENVALRIANLSASAQIEWLDNEGDEITSARNRNTLVLSNVREENTGIYAAVVFDPDAGCNNPIFLEFEVFVAPGLPQPARLNISEEIACVGQNINLTASPVGNGFEYIWIGPDGEEITRCRNARVCRINNVSEANEGPYLVQVGNPDLGPCAIGEAENILIVVEGPGRVSSAEDPFLFCEGANAEFKVNTSNTGDYNYVWLRPDGVQQMANGVNGSLVINNIQATDNGFYSLLVSNPDGSCSTELNDGDGVVVIVNDGIEQPTITTLGDGCDALPTLQVSTSDNQIVSWFDENNDLVAENTTTFLPIITGNYYVVIFDPSSGCESPQSELFLVEQGVGITATISAEQEQVCPRTTTTLTAIGGTQFLWSTGATTANIQANPGNYTVTVTNIEGCTGIATFTVEAFPNFEIAITGDAQVCEGNLSTLTANGGTQYRWNTNATSPVIQVAAGEYSVTVTNENGCEKVANFSVEAYPDFEVNITGEEQVCGGNLSTLTANGGTQYRWNTNATSPIIQVAAGEYQVTVTNENGCEKVANFSVEAYPDFEVNITGEEQVCGGNLSTLTANGGAQYRWSTNATSPVIQVAAGEYSVTVTNENGCEKVANFIVEAYPDFEVNITGDEQVCGGNLSTLTANGGTQYRWNTNATSPIIQVAAGEYQVTVTNENGCEKVANFIVEAYPDFEANITGDEQICGGNLSTLTANGGTQYRWNTNVTSPTVQVAAGDYTVTITNENGCEKVASFSVEAYPDFEANIIGDEQICGGNLSTLTANGGTQYRWSTNATSPIIQVTTGNYSVTVTNENGCEKVANFSVEAYPDFEVEIAGETAVCTEGNTTLMATEGESYLWSNGATSQNITVGIGDYTVTVTNENGCESTQNIRITENPFPTLSISNSATCASDLTTYQLDIIAEIGNTIMISDGRLIEGAEGLFRIIEIPAGEDLSITIENEFGCSITQIIPAPECACPTIAAPISNGNLEICAGDELPKLSVNTSGENISINWFDAPTNGNLLLAESNEFTPKEAGIYYAEAISTESGCTSDIRIAVTLVVNPLPQIIVSDLLSIDCENSAGNFSVEGSGGTAPYEYALDDGDFQTAVRFDDLGARTYDVFIKDANGCINQTTASIEAKIRIDQQRFTQYSCNIAEFGIDTLFLINELSCDSLIITTTLNGRTPATILMENTCDRSQVEADTLFLKNQFDCDSLIITNYILVASDTTFLNGTTCDAGAAGERTLNLENQFGCDSIVVINTVFSDKDMLTFDLLTCNPSQVGIDTSFFINRLGCDSLIIRNTSLQGTNDTTRLRIATCDFNSIGIDTSFLSNETGCDSLVITERFFSFPAPPVIEASGGLTACEGDSLVITTNSYDTGLQWLKDGAEIDNATDTMLLITTAGTYGVSYINEEGCAVVSSTLTLVFLAAPDVPTFSNENNLLSLENSVAFEDSNLQWYFEGMAIEGATSSTYCSSASGGYSLIATDPNTNCSTAFALFVEYDEVIENCVVNAKNTLENVAIQVYPNPYQSYFNVALETPKAVKLEVINLFGQVLYQQELSNNSGSYFHRIESGQWAAGIYYLRVEAAGRMKVIKMVKVD